jgi:MoaA/NifB/PqqE/SkfB family radical SAM enzyme
MQASSVARGALARLGMQAYPLSLTCELTWRCHLACAYCDRHTPLRHEMRREEIVSALDQAYALGMRRTTLDGGEALVHRHVDEIVDRLVARGVEVHLNSNGILVPKKIATVRRLRRLKISVDGPRASHDTMRGKGSFARARASRGGAGGRGSSRVRLRCRPPQRRWS